MLAHCMRSYFAGFYTTGRTGPRSAVAALALLLSFIPLQGHGQWHKPADQLKGQPLRSTTFTASGPYIQGGDPFVLRTPDGSLYLYTTNRPGLVVPVYRSDDHGDWEALGDALPKLPPWARRGRTWAPEVIRLNSGKYVLFYTAANQLNGKQCIGRAESATPYGPFIDTSLEPFVCNVDTQTSIDPSPFLDGDGHLYLLWKTMELVDDDRHLSKIWIQTLTPGGLRDSDEARLLLQSDQPWEGKHVEAPTLVRHGGRYYLFYSAGASTPMRYAVSYAVADEVTGPYRKSDRPPILRSNGHLRGPGHQSLSVIGPNAYAIYFHSVYPERRLRRTDKARYIDRAFLCFEEHAPTIRNSACPGDAEEPRPGPD